jgi:hypothetical protein
LQPTGPLIKPELCQIVTNDYKRHAATTTLFAALGVFAQ